jgi:hypothetical protein
MKKMIFALLVLLLAGPAWATIVNIDCNQVGDTNQVEVTYTTDGTLVRAVGLDITVTDGNILACEPAMVGECTATEKGLGIFPGTIIIDAGGNVTDYGSPVAPQSDLPGDTLGGLGTSGITVEMGSLYVDGNAPPTSGLLCTITVEDTVTQMTITANVSRAGNGVVLEDPDEVATVNLAVCNIEVGGPPCFYAGLVDCCGQTVTAADVARWASLSLADQASWCDPCHCRGDADGSCVIDAVDVLALRAAWPGLGGTYDARTDTNYDGVIDAIDVLALRAAWPGLGGNGCTGCPPCP